MSALLAIILTAAASNLNATDESLTATTTTTAATDVTVNYVEFTTSSGANIGSGEQVTNFTTATTSTVLSAPSAGTTTRSPSFIKACNKGTASQTVTIQYVKTAGSLTVRQAIMSLNAGECGTVGNDGTLKFPNASQEELMRKAVVIFRELDMSEDGKRDFTDRQAGYYLRAVL